MTRPRFFASGVLVLVAVWGVLPILPVPPFTAHMLMHMSVVAIAAPLLVLGFAGGRLDPVRRAGGGWSPIVASMVELVLVWAWHAPALHHAARHHAWAQALEQLSFLGAGLYLWMAALGGGPRLRRARAAGGSIGLLLTSMHMTLLGALLVLGHRALYAHGSSAGAWLSPVHDQQLGGALMLVMGGLAYLAGALWLTADVLAARTEERR